MAFLRHARLVMWGLAATVAMAIPVRAAEFIPPTYNYFDWSGVYIGAHGGGGFADFDISRGSATPVGTPGTTSSGDGGLFGLLAGINIQRGIWVFGAEGDIAFGGVDAPNPVATLPTLEINTIGTIRGRVGIAHGRWLFYGTAGVGFADVDGFEVGNGGTVVSRDHVGFVGGGGIEYAVTDNVIIRGEYLHGAFGSEVYPIPPPAMTPHSHTIDFELDIVRAAVIWLF